MREIQNSLLLDQIPLQPPLGFTRCFVEAMRRTRPRSYPLNSSVWPLVLKIRKHDEERKRRNEREWTTMSINFGDKFKAPGQRMDDSLAE